MRLTEGRCDVKESTAWAIRAEMRSLREGLDEMEGLISRLEAGTEEPLTWDEIEACSDNITYSAEKISAIASEEYRLLRRAQRRALEGRVG